MAKLRNKRKFEAIYQDNHKEISSSNRSGYTFFPGILDEYITQVSEEIKGRMTKKMSLVFSWRERVSCSGRFIQGRRNPSELTSPGALWIRSGDNPEFLGRKPGNQ